MKGGGQSRESPGGGQGRRSRGGGTPELMQECRLCMEIPELLGIEGKS